MMAVKEKSRSGEKMFVDRENFALNECGLLGRLAVFAGIKGVQLVIAPHEVFAG